MNPCVKPVIKEDIDGDGRWMSMHNLYVAEAKRCEPEVVWIGDSIIQQLQFSDLWNDISSLHCLNFGIGGDRVEHVLWRLQNGELEFNSAVKALVLFVGTNNVTCTSEQIFEGIRECIKVIREKLGLCHIIIPTLLPKCQYPNKFREINEGVNKLLLEYYCPEKNNPEQTNIHVIEIDKNLIQSDGSLSHHLFYDYLHLTNTGYSKIFRPVYEKLCDILRK